LPRARSRRWHSRDPPAATSRRKSSSAFSFGNGLGWRGRRRLKACPPKGKRLQIFVPLLPRFLAQVLTAKAVAVAKEQGVKILARRKRPARQGAGFSPVLDRPLVA
jgi:hypothetical protein